MNTITNEAGMTIVIAKGRSVVEAFRSRTITMDKEKTFQVYAWLNKVWEEFVKPKVKENPCQKYHRLLLKVQNLHVGESTFNGLLFCVVLLNADGTFGEARLLMATTDENGQVTGVSEPAGLTFDKLSIR
jgi:hypothetical protein